MVIKKMNEKVLDIQPISTKRSEIKADRVLLLGQMTEKKDKTNPSHFLKFLLSYPQAENLVLLKAQADPSQNQKNRFLANIRLISKLQHGNK